MSEELPEKFRKQDWEDDETVKNIWGKLDLIITVAAVVIFFSLMGIALYFQRQSNDIIGRYLIITAIVILGCMLLVGYIFKYKSYIVVYKDVHKARKRVLRDIAILFFVAIVIALIRGIS